MIGSVVVALAVFAATDAACAPTAVVRGVDASAVRALIAELHAAGVAASEGRAPPPSAECPALGVEVSSTAPTYAVSVARAGRAARTLSVRSLTLAAALIESELGRVPAPPPWAPAERTSTALIARGGVAMDERGAVFVGPSAQLHACSDALCLDLTARYGQAVRDPSTTGRRTEIAASGGASLALGDAQAGLWAGVSMGARWSGLWLPATRPSTIDWPGAPWPFEAHHESALLFAWAARAGGHLAVHDALVLDGEVALEHVPEGDTPGEFGVAPASTLLVRAGLGLRWNVGR